MVCVKTEIEFKLNFIYTDKNVTGSYQRMYTEHTLNMHCVDIVVGNVLPFQAAQIGCNAL